MIKGIYKIENKENGKVYIGSSKNIHKRWLQHKRTLDNGTHHNVLLQRSYYKYGKDNFTFDILEECTDILTKEAEYISEYKPDYNIGSIGGGDNITNHPDRERIVCNLVKVLRNIPKPGPRYGESNSNWKGGPKLCECGSEIAKSANSCFKCMDRSGSANPFFGRTHSESTKECIRNHRLGKPNLKCSKPLNTPDGVFSSLTSASDFYNKTPGAILNRIRSDKPKWSDYYYLNVERLSLEGE